MLDAILGVVNNWVERELKSNILVHAQPKHNVRRYVNKSLHNNVLILTYIRDWTLKPKCRYLLIRCVDFSKVERRKISNTGYEFHLTTNFGLQIRRLTNKKEHLSSFKFKMMVIQSIGICINRGMWAPDSEEQMGGIISSSVVGWSPRIEAFPTLH